jgi:hypothetical protein
MVDITPAQVLVAISFSLLFVIFLYYLSKVIRSIALKRETRKLTNMEESEDRESAFKLKFQDLKAKKILDQFERKIKNLKPKDRDKLYKKTELKLINIDPMIIQTEKPTGKIENQSYSINKLKSIYNSK